ncbi:MAG TPA: sensor histidine kinase KdpD [Bacteroidota bacterium]|nr:sensor histidine kinase KdpD [Bacteroidota bacterium]
MSPTENTRPDPDILLHALKKEEERAAKAKLKIFFGMCAGVGKTYDMLSAAHDARTKGIDVVIGIVETHKRPETEALLAGLEVVPRKKIDYRGTAIEEMDLDAIIARKPKLVLVDELAHSNAPGSRHTKRYQDVEELLDNGIDVYSTLNVQHLESRADAVAQITGSVIRETVPDSVFERADDIEVIDIPPDELLKRLAEGKVYAPERSQQAIQNFFRKGNLTALREMSLRLTAERVDHQLRDYMRTEQIVGPWKSGQRIIVGISASPHSISVIRWARRLSYTMNATWVVVCVETSNPIHEEDKEQLSKNIQLARELGAEVVTTADEDVANALIRVAREQNATQILVGKSRPTFFSGSQRLIEDLIQKSKNVDIYVVGQETEAGPEKGRSRIPGTQSSLMQYALAPAIVVLIALSCFPFAHLIGYETVSLIILLTVSLLPLRMGPGPVLVAAAAGAVTWDFFFIPPLFTFSIGHPEDILMLGVYFIVALVTGVLSARVRAREKAVRHREERTAALFALTKDLSSAHSQEEVIKAAVSNIKKYFDADVAMILGEADGEIAPAPHPASSMTLDAKEYGVASWSYWNEKKAGKYTDTLPSAEATYFPISGPRYPLGVIGVRLLREEKLTVDEETSLDNFIAQIASAMERELLNDVNKKSIVVAESERLYKILFNSISHELRTPIAAIMGASENLSKAFEKSGTEPAQAYTKEIHTATERLNRLVANLLDMSRLESGMIQPKMDWCDVHDLINVSLRGLEGELAGRKVTVTVQPEMPLVKLDFGLIEQALTNLIHNAVVHTQEGSPIEVNAGVEGKECFIVVADNGAGLSKNDVNRVFEKFYRAEGLKGGGAGLGLPIAKGFVEAHKGTISAKNRTSGGAEFMLRIPVTEATPAERALP